MQANTQPSEIPKSPTRVILPKVIIGCLAGCGVLIILLVILGAIAFQSGSKSTAQADMVGRQFLQAVKNNQPDAAYALTAPEWQRSSSVAVLKEYMGKWRSTTGDFGEITLKGQRWYSGT